MAGTRSMSSERRDYHRKLEDLGFVLVRSRKHRIYKHPSGATACMATSASDYHSLKNSVMDARKELRQRGIDPDAQAPAPVKKPEPAPAPVIIDTSPLPVVHVPERQTTKPPPPVFSDFKSWNWCIQFHCYGRWVCMEQQRSPTPERALMQCSREVRDWYKKAHADGKSRIEPKDI